MPRVTQAHLDARNRQILASAHRCFARQGFHGATMEEIADGAGLSVGALYRYFKNKEALIEALAAWGREQKRSAVEVLAPGGGGEALGRMVEEILHLLNAKDADMAVRLDVRLWGESLGQPALARIVADGLEALHEPIATHVRRERRAGRIRRQADPDAIARVVVALIAGIELQRAFDPDLDVASCGAAARLFLETLTTGPVTPGSAAARP
jgi:AcrR family transcriptional regulator